MRTLPLILVALFLSFSCFLPSFWTFLRLPS